MTVKQNHSTQPTAYSSHATTVHFSRSLTRTAVTVAILGLALVLILVLR